MFLHTHVGIFFARSIYFSLIRVQNGRDIDLTYEVSRSLISIRKHNQVLEATYHEFVGRLPNGNPATRGLPGITNYTKGFLVVLWSPLQNISNMRK